MKNPVKILLKENNEQEKLLTKENEQILTDMIVYLHSSNLSEYDIQIIRKELLGMALESQLREEDFTKVIGNDYKDFCNELINNSRKKTGYEKLLEILYIITYSAGILILFEIITHMIGKIIKKEEIDLIFQLPISLGFILSTTGAIIIAYGIVQFISKTSFELTLEKKYKIIYPLAFFIVLTGLILARIYFDSVILFSLNNIYLATFWIIALIIVKLLEGQYFNYLAKTHKYPF